MSTVVIESFKDREIRGNVLIPEQFLTVASETIGLCC